MLINANLILKEDLIASGRGGVWPRWPLPSGNML